MALASSGGSFRLTALIVLLSILFFAMVVFAAEPYEVGVKAVVDCSFREGYVPVDVAVRSDGVVFVGTVHVVDDTRGLIYRIGQEGFCDAVGVGDFGLDVDEFGAPCSVTYRLRFRGDYSLFFAPPADVVCFPQVDSWGPRTKSYRDWWGERIFVVDARWSASTLGFHSFGFHYSAGIYWKGVWVRSSSSRESNFSSAYLVGIKQVEGEEYVVEEMHRVAPGEVVARIVMTPWAPYFITSLDDETLVVSGLRRPQIPFVFMQDGRVLPVEGPGALLLVGVEGDIRVLSEDFVYPSGVLVVGDVIFVADQVTGEVHRHSLSGERISSLSGFSEPMGLALAPNGGICVAEVGAERVICVPQSAFGGASE